MNKKRVLLCLGLLFMGVLQVAEAKGLWQLLIQTDPEEANRYAGAKFLKHGMLLPSPDAWREDGESLFSEEKKIQINGKISKAQKWFKRRTVHRDLFQDPGPQGENYRGSLQYIQDEMDELLSPGGESVATEMVICLFFSEEGVCDLVGLKKVFEDLDAQKEPPSEEWSQKGFDLLRRFWELWNWKALGV